MARNPYVPQTPADRPGWFTRFREGLLWNGDMKEATADVTQRANELQSHAGNVKFAETQLEAAKKQAEQDLAAVAGRGERRIAKVTARSNAAKETAEKALEAAKKNYTDVQPAFNRAADRVGFARGKFFESVKGSGYSIGEWLGFDTSKWGAKVVKGDAAAAASKALSKDAGIFERAFSKPFRVAANHPGGAVAVGAVAAIGAGAYMLSSHKNNSTITPEEYALMQSRMRQGGQQGGFASAEQARREAAQGQNAVS